MLFLFKTSRLFIKFSVLGYFLSIPFGLVAAPLQVIFLNPGKSDETYWVMFSSFMQAAATQLDINLEVIYSERNHVLMTKQASESVSRATKPDYLVLVNEKLAAEAMLEIADKAKVKTFLSALDLTAEQKQNIGRPREKLSHWLGTLTPDNRYAGYLIGKTLIDQSLKKLKPAKDGKYHLVAINGSRVTPATVLRKEGLDKVLAEYPQVSLQQEIFAEWEQVRAAEMTVSLLARYPETSMIWAANDPMGLGALESALKAGRKVGTDLFIGGLNWSTQGITAVEENKFVTTVGGHFMLGAWTLIELYDYHHGKDFKEEGLEQVREIFGSIDADNIKVWKEKFGEQKWESIDFSKFSKVKNPSLTKYDFSLKTIFQSLKK